SVSIIMTKIVSVIEKHVISPVVRQAIGEDLKKLQKRIAQIETPKRFKLGDKVEFNNYFMYPPKVGKVVDTIFHEADKGSHYWEYVIWVKKEKASHRFHDTKYLLFTSIQHYKPTSKSKKKR
ncbi:hypothetical protein LCGC14_2983300, partial [marine sediment metagenome]